MDDLICEKCKENITNQVHHVCRIGSARSDQAAYNKYYYERKKGEIAEQKKKYREAIKHEVVVMLGGKCSQCGFDNEKALFVVGGGGRGKMSYVAWWNFLYRHFNDKSITETPYYMVCANCREIHELV